MAKCKYNLSSYGISKYHCLLKEMTQYLWLGILHRRQALTIWYLSHLLHLCHLWSSPLYALTALSLDDLEDWTPLHGNIFEVGIIQTFDYISQSHYHHLTLLLMIKILTKIYIYLLSNWFETFSLEINLC